MKPAIAILILIVVTGCSSTPGGRGSRLLPWNWFSPDHATQLADAEEKKANTEDAVTNEAHRDMAKTVNTLLADPAPNKYTSQALRFSRHGLGLLDQVRQIPFAQQQEDQQLVADLLSENVQIRTAAIKREAADEAAANAMAIDLAAAKKVEGVLTKKLKVSDIQYQAQAEKYRRVWFWIWIFVGGYILLQALSGISKFFPALAPVTQFAGTILAPAMQGAYNRLTKAVGTAISDAEKTSQEQADNMRRHIEAQPIDEADVKAIKTQYLKAP